MKAAVEASLALTAVAKVAVAEFQAENDRFPDTCHEVSSSDLCESLAPGISLRRAGTVLVDLGTATHDPKLAGQYIKLAPAVEASGDVDWQCSVTPQSPVAFRDCPVDRDFRMPEEVRDVNREAATSSDHASAATASGGSNTVEPSHALNCHFDSSNQYVCEKVHETPGVTSRRDDGTPIQSERSDAPADSRSNGNIDSGVYAASRNQMLVVKDAIRDAGKALLILGSNGRMACEEGDVGCLALSGSAKRSGDGYQFASESGDCMLSLSPNASRVVIAYTKGSCGLGSANSNLIASIAGTYVLNVEK
jgi:hypothetical protein